MNTNKPVDSAVNEENYRTEYREVAAAWRFFASLRFIVAAFTLPIQSALFTLYQQRTTATAATATLSSRFLEDAGLVAIAGLLSTAAIIAIEYRTIGLITLFVKRGITLEFRLGLERGHFDRLAEPTFWKPSGLKLIMTHTGGLPFIYLSIWMLWFMFYFAAL